MRAAPLLVALAAAAFPACGYAPVHGEAPPARLAVKLVRAPIADAVLADEVVSGVREDLLREGALVGGDGYPRVEIEVLRVDESSAGIADVGGSPRARGAEIVVVARAWIAVDKDRVEHDTGDMRGSAVVTAASPSLELESVRHADAVHAAGRRIGRRLAQKVLGHPALSDE